MLCLQQKLTQVDDAKSPRIPHRSPNLPWKPAPNHPQDLQLDRKRQKYRVFAIESDVSR